MDWEARYRNLNSILITIRDIVQDAEKFRRYRGDKVPWTKDSVPDRTEEHLLVQQIRLLVEDSDEQTKRLDASYKNDVKKLKLGWSRLKAARKRQRKRRSQIVEENKRLLRENKKLRVDLIAAERIIARARKELAVTEV